MTTIPANVLSTRADSNNISYVRRIILPSTTAEIGNNAFLNCENLIEISLPKSVKRIGISAFEGCTGLEVITMEDNTEREFVTTIENRAFYGDISLTNIRLAENVTTIGNDVFSECSKLETVVLSSQLTSIGNYVFNECSKLETITLTSQLQNIGYYCFKGTAIRSITIPKTVIKCDRDVWNNGPFAGAKQLEEVIFEEGMTTIPANVLSTRADSNNISYVSKAYIPSTVTSIGDKAFYNCDNLTIYGRVNSYAQTYANENNIPFVEWEGAPPISSGIESITKTDIVEDTAYDITTYKSTLEGEIYDNVIEYNMALNDYLDAIKLSAEGDLHELNSGTSNVAAKLREADEMAAKKDMVVLMEADIPEDALDSVYEALAMYLDCYTQKAFELGKINGNNTIEIGTNIVNKVRNSMNQTTFTRKIGQYTVTFKTIGFGGANTGSVQVEARGRKKYTGIVNTSTKKTAELMTLYINDLSDTVRDLLKSALVSVFTELSDTIGISEYTKKKLNNFLKDKVELLMKNGYGDILKNTVKLRDTYELIKDIVAASSAADLQEALSKSTSIYNKIKKMDYSDDAIKKAVIQAATDKLNDINKNFEELLNNYINGNKNEDNNSWSWFKKIFVQCPVDFIVYDMDDNVLGYVDNNDVSYNEKIFIKTSGDVKTLYVPADMEVKLKFSATGNGSMNYVIEEVQDKKITGRMNYYNVPLIENENYFQVLTTDSLTNDVEMMPIKKSDGTSIYADEYISASDKDAGITINTSADVGGVTIGNGKYPKGNPVELLALGTDDTYEFCGWYINDILVELNNVYRFTALENVDVHAKFEKKLIASTDYKIVLDEFYDDFAWVDVYENEQNSEDVAMRLQGVEIQEDYNVVNVKRYFADGQCTSDTVSTEYDNNFSFWLRGINLKESIKTQIYDGSDNLIVTISQNGEDISYTVTFDTQNLATSPAPYTNITAGSRITPPEVPVAEQYIFIGWFKDAECTIPWDFDVDTVESDITLYAGWKALDNNPEGVLPEDIPADGIPQGLWIAGVKDWVYTGKAIKQEVRVYDGNKRLKEKIDYTISYKNNTKANNASITKKAPTIVVKGKGNYGGTETAIFKILPVDLNDTGVIVDDITLAFNNKVQKPIPSISYNGKKLRNKVDFTVSYPDLKDGGAEALKKTGTYRIEITAKKDEKGNDIGNFAGTRTILFTITNSILISKANVKKIPNQIYNGSAIEPKLQVVFKNRTLTEGQDYHISYQNNMQIGTATAILTGLNDFAGTKKVTFKIVGTPIKSADVSTIEREVYDGTQKCPEPQICVNGITLQKDKDYKISYQNNKDAGKAKVIISGINSYSGTLKKTFQITPYDIQQDSKKQITGFSQDIVVKYTKGGSKPSIELSYNGTKMTAGKDYSITYKNNKAVTTSTTTKQPIIIITGKGNFKGSLSRSFTITQRDFNDTEVPVKLTVADKAFVDKGGKYISKPILMDIDGKKLTAGVDYEKEVIYTLVDGTPLTYESIVKAGSEIILKVKGKGAYTGELTKTYRITKSDFGRAKITISAQTYTGSAITLNEDDIAVKIGETQLVYGTDYEILPDSYTNNVKKGTATVTIVGKGNYGGSKQVKFKITAKKFSWFWRLFG